MIGTLRKHQNWLWFVIIAAIIVSFVWFFSPTAKMSGNDRAQVDLGSINGKPITIKEYTDAEKETSLAMFLKYQQWPDQNERMRDMLKESTYQWLQINTKLKELDVQVPPVATARMIKQMFGLEPNQALPPEKFQEFLQTQLYPHGLGEQDFERFIAHQVGQQHLVSLFGMSGKLITQKEAESFYRRENEPIQAQMAAFSISNYVSKVTVDAKDLEDFYSKNQANYRVLDKVQINYVKFEATNFVAEAKAELHKQLGTNLNVWVNKMYAKMGAEAFKDEAGTQLSESAAKAQIENRQLHEVAIQFAIKKANEFLTELYNSCSDTKPFKPEDFETLAKANGLKVKTTEPFDQETGPRQLKSAELVQHAFRLVEDPLDPSKRSLFSTSPIVVEDSVCAISLKQMFTSHLQPLEAVRSEVTDDYRNYKAQDLAVAAGKQFAASATNGLAANKTFSAICAANKVKEITLSPFSISTRSIPELDNNTLDRVQQVVSSLAPGKCSPFVPSANGGFVLFVEKHLPVDTAKMATDLPAFTDQLRERRQSAAYIEWFQKAAREMKLIRPIQK